VAIDKHQTKELLARIESMFESEVLAWLSLPAPVVALVRTQVMGPALDELRRLVDEARPPAFYLLGQSGHGKSSLLNALAGQGVAPVGAGAEPCTVETKEYVVRFPDRHAEWVFYDSRGLFDRNDAAKLARQDAVSTAIADILQRRPDVVLHVLHAKQVRAMKPDIDVLRQVQAAVVQQRGVPVPLIAALTHSDSLGDDVTEWPPEQFPDKQAAIAEFVRAMAEHGAGKGHRPIGSKPPYYGCRVEYSGSPYLYIVPVNVPAKAKQRWNLGTLADVIERALPEDARLLFNQALQRKEALRQIAEALTRRFAAIAFGIGATPIPVADLFLLAPLQMLLVAAVAGLSCRQPNLETVKEYAVASGVVWAAGMALREVCRQLIKLLPLPGLTNVVAGKIAAARTYALGRSAQAYFFKGEVRPPAEFKEEGEGFASGLEPQNP
jgi:predicted GTPase/uncharacterized protein (DUF697 family)